MNQTIIDYGAVRLWNVQTNSITQEQVLGEGGVDVIYSKITVHVVGYIRRWSSGQGESGVRSNVVTFSPGDPLAVPTITGAVPSTLTANVDEYRDRVGHRSSFRMTIGADADGSGGQVHLWASPYPDKETTGLFVLHSGVREWWDCNAGPHCRTFTETKLCGEHIARVEAVFELCLPYCTDFDNDFIKVLENRWSVSDSINQDGYTTRTYNGVLRLANPLLNPNQFRQLVIPPMVDGMRRVSMTFDVGADQRSLKYAITDRESTVAPPAPATSFEMTHSDSVNIGKGLIYTTLRITLTGNRNSNRKVLVQTAVAIAEEKLTGVNIANGANNGQVMMQEMSITDHIGCDAPTRIDVSITCSRVRDDGIGFDATKGPLGILPVGTGFPAGGYGAGGVYDVDANFDPGIEGPVSLKGALIPFFRSVCYGEDGVPAGKGDSIRTGTPPASNSLRAEVGNPVGLPTVASRVVPLVPASRPTYVSAQNEAGIYTHYQIESQWNTEHNRVQCSLAESEASYSAGGDSCVVVALGLPRTTRTIRIEAVRLKYPPNIQEPKTSYSVTSGSYPFNFTLLSKKILPQAPERTVDGTEVYGVSAEFVYAANRHPLNGETVPIGIDPSFSGARSDLAAGALNTFDETATIS